jgi:DNA-binding HxlR family transcriptional regulator
MEKEDGEAVEETRVMELFRSKWALSVLVALSDGDLRFNELKRTVGSAPSNTLSDRLSDLEAEGLITRTVEDGAPPRVTYALTPRGRQVVEIIERIEQL